MDPTLSLIMPSRAMTQAAIEKLVSDRVGMWSKFPTVNEGAVDVKRWFEGKRKVFLASAYVDEKQEATRAMHAQRERIDKVETCEVKRADKSFVDVRFSHLLDIKPAKLNTSYEVKLADGKVLGTFDVIIGMDWLVERDAVIVCGKARKIHRKRGIPFVLLAQVTEKRTVKITVARCASDCNFLRCFLMIFQDSHHLEKLNLELSLCPEPHLSGGDPITVWARLN
ncbi:hypothetical protein Tco_0972201 [Tanacetum coccineum]